MKKKCPICDKTFNGRKERICCSKPCSNVWRSITMVGLTHKKFNKKKIKCPICRSVFIPSRVERLTCSSKCGHELQAIKISGENNPNYNSDLKIKCCSYCGIVFRRYTSKSREDSSKYCSKFCCDLNKIKSKTELKCFYCGKLFLRNRWKVDNTTKHYCSRSCYTNHINLRSYKVDLMIKWLEELGIYVEEERTFPWLKSDKRYSMYLDLYLPEYKTGIEYDGRHHFFPTFEKDDSNTLDRKKFLDKTKNRLCKENNINIIRFSFDDVFNKEIFLKSLNLWYSPTPKEIWEN